MKIFYLKLSCIFFVLVQIFAIGFSQNLTVSIQRDDISLEQLFSEIESQTVAKFLYRYENIAGRNAKIHAENTPVSVVLDNALKTNGLQYTLMDHNLIVVAPKVKVETKEVKLQERYITGRITDASDGAPIPYASVFIANTTVGTSSDEFGNYSMTVPGVGSFEIVVSHVGYQSVFHKIDTPKSFHQIDFALEAKELQEVTVTARSNYSQKDIDLFWHRLLGVKPSKNGMEALNPEKVYFYVNSDNVLKVSCKDLIL